MWYVPRAAVSSKSPTTDISPKYDKQTNGRTVY